MTTFTYTNSRFGDTFNVYLDEDKDHAFVGAMRFVGYVGEDGIPYDTLEEIPQPYRHEIEQKIHNVRRAK